jgi:hypothetical protein
MLIFDERRGRREVLAPSYATPTPSLCSLGLGVARRIVAL